MTLLDYALFRECRMYIMQFFQFAWHRFARKQLKLLRYKSFRIRTGRKWNTMGIHSPSRSMTANLDECELNRQEKLHMYQNISFAG